MICLLVLIVIVIGNETRTNFNNKKGKFHLRYMLKDVFGLDEHHRKPTFGLGYKLTLIGNKDDTVLQKAVALADARMKIDHIH